LSLNRDEGQYFISRHTTDGKIINSPSLFPFPLRNWGSSEEVIFKYIPQSEEILLFNICPLDYHAYLINPTDEEHLVQKIDLLSKPIDVLKIGSQLLILFSKDNKLFAVNNENMFYNWESNKLVPHKEAVPFITLQKESPLHDLQILPVNREQQQFLIIQSRKPQIRPLSDEELISAGKKFLPDDDFADCKNRLNIEFNDYLISKLKNYHADTYYKEKGIPNWERGKSWEEVEREVPPLPKLNSLEDVNSNFPDFYKTLQEEAKRNMINYLRICLCNKLEREDYDWEYFDKESDYKNKAEYKTWLKDIWLHGEFIFEIIDIKGHVLSSAKIDGYYPYDDNDKIEYTRYKGYHLCLMSLQKESNKKKYKPGHYIVGWGNKFSK